MGIINKGVNGGFSGKAGSVVGSSWNGIDYIKGLYKKRTKTSSQKQLDQQSKFKLAISFLRPIAKLLYQTFKAFSKNKKSGVNAALQNLLFRAIKGIYPNYEIDHPKVVVADGPLAEADCIAVAAPNNQIQLNWDNDVNTHNAEASDSVSVLIYDPTKNFFKSYTDIATRADGVHTINVSASMVGKSIHVYMYLKSESGKFSRSVYAGEVIIE